MYDDKMVLSSAESIPHLFREWQYLWGKVYTVVGTGTQYESSIQTDNIVSFREGISKIIFRSLKETNS